MVKIAVCDDEKNIRLYLLDLIRKQEVSCELAEFSSACDYLADGREFDLLFLDIELGGAGSCMDGLNLAGRLRKMELETQPVIIFVTGHEQYVYDAFDVDAFQYLLKPINEQRFSEVFKRAVSRASARRGERQNAKALVIQSANTRKTVLLDNICYIESRNHKVALHLKDGIFEYYARIGDLEEELQGQFCRIHRGYLINLSCVQAYSKTEVTLENGERLLISKYKYNDFVKAHLHFIKRGLTNDETGACI